jgi:hypothetical protein
VINFEISPTYSRKNLLEKLIPTKNKKKRNVSTFLKINIIISRPFPTVIFRPFPIVIFPSLSSSFVCLYISIPHLIRFLSSSFIRSFSSSFFRLFVHHHLSSFFLFFTISFPFLSLFIIAFLFFIISLSSSFLFHSFFIPPT